MVPGGEYRQEAGRELVIPCEAEGDPFPNITWRKVRPPVCVIWLSNFVFLIMSFYVGFMFSIEKSEFLSPVPLVGAQILIIQTTVCRFSVFNHILMMSIKYVIKGTHQILSIVCLIMSHV